jgi:hypothetical protein
MISNALLGSWTAISIIRRGHEWRVMPKPSTFWDSSMRSAIVASVITCAITWALVSKQDQEKANEVAIDSRVAKAIDPAASKELRLTDRLAAIEKSISKTDASDKRLADIDSRLVRIEEKLSGSDSKLTGLDVRISEQSKNIEQLHTLFVNALQGKFTKARGMSPDELNRDAAGLLAAVRLAEALDVRVDSETLKRIRLGLGRITNPSDGAYWQLASSVTTKESATTTRIEPPSGPPVRLGAVSGNKFNGVHVVIDGSNFSYNTFEDCLIEYRGGPAIVRQSIFINCVFLLRLNSDPGQGGQHFAQQIMASNNLGRVSVN